MDLELPENVAMVTGASKGIGLACAQALADSRIDGFDGGATAAI